jgi:hypothetical protein
LRCRFSEIEKKKEGKRKMERREDVRRGGEEIKKWK